MLKKAVLILMFVLLAAPIYAAPERAGHWDAGFQAAAAIPSDDELDAAVQLAGTLAYGVNEWLAIGFSGAWQNHDSDDTIASGIVIPGPEITGVPLFGEVILRVPAGDRPFAPYGILGFGTVVWSIDDTTATSGGVPITAQTDVDTEFAFKLGGGVDWFLDEHWIVNLEAAYVFSSPEASVTATVPGASATITEEIDLDYWTVGMGVKYRF